MVNLEETALETWQFYRLLNLIDRCMDADAEPIFLKYDNEVYVAKPSSNHPWLPESIIRSRKGLTDIYQHIPVASFDPVSRTFKLENTEYRQLNEYHKILLREFNFAAETQYSL